MNDPHVECLHYKIKHGDHVDYTKASPFEHEEPDFVVRIANGSAVTQMKTHFAAVEDARTTVERFLRAWELDVDLRYGPRSLEFVYERPEIVDRNPSPGTHAFIAEPISLTLCGGEAKACIGFSMYPTPPKNMIRDATTNDMFAKYVYYRQGRRALADAAYYCLTALKKENSLSAAAQRYQISEKVLRELSRLATTKGGSEARKADGATNAFNAAERRWLEEVMTL